MVSSACSRPQSRPVRVLFRRLSKLPAWLPPVAVIPPEQGRFDPLDGPRFHERQREMGVALIAPTISRLYESAGFLTFGLFADLETVGSLRTRDVVVQGRTESALLEGWIHTLLSMSLQENCLFSRFQVEAVEPRRIR